MVDKLLSLEIDGKTGYDILHESGVQGDNISEIQESLLNMIVYKPQSKNIILGRCSTNKSTQFTEYQSIIGYEDIAKATKSTYMSFNSTNIYSKLKERFNTETSSILFYLANAPYIQNAYDSGKAIFVVHDDILFGSGIYRERLFLNGLIPDIKLKQCFISRTYGKLEVFEINPNNPQEVIINGEIVPIEKAYDEVIGGEVYNAKTRKGNLALHPAMMVENGKGV